MDDAYWIIRLVEERDKIAGINALREDKAPQPAVTQHRGLADGRNGGADRASYPTTRYGPG